MLRMWEIEDVTDTCKGKAEGELTRQRKEPLEEPSVKINQQQIDWLFQTSDSWAIVFAEFEGQINKLFPAD